MRASPETPPPSDAKARRAAAPVRVYTGEGFPKFDAEFYRKARFGAQKIAEAIVPPREARCFHAPAGYFFRIVSIEGPQVGVSISGTRMIFPSASSAARPAPSTRRM